MHRYCYNSQVKNVAYFPTCIWTLTICLVYNLICSNFHGRKKKWWCSCLLWLSLAFFCSTNILLAIIAHSHSPSILSKFFLNSLLVSLFFRNWMFKNLYSRSKWILRSPKNVCVCGEGLKKYKLCAIKLGTIIIFAKWRRKQILELYVVGCFSFSVCVRPFFFSLVFSSYRSNEVRLGF